MCPDVTKAESGLFSASHSPAARGHSHRTPGPCPSWESSGDANYRSVTQGEPERLLKKHKAASETWQASSATLGSPLSTGESWRLCLRRNQNHGSFKLAGKTSTAILYLGRACIGIDTRRAFLTRKRFVFALLIQPDQILDPCNYNARLLRASSTCLGVGARAGAIQIASTGRQCLIRWLIRVFRRPKQINSTSVNCLRGTGRTHVF